VRVHGRLRLQFPSLIFFRTILGLPEDNVRRISGHIARLLCERTRRWRCCSALMPECVGVLNDRKDRRDDDVLEAIVHGQLDDGRAMTDLEQLQVFVNLISAGWRLRRTRWAAR